MKSKTRYKKKKLFHSCRITCERSESAQQRRIALYKKAINNLPVISAVPWTGVIFLLLVQSACPVVGDRCALPLTGVICLLLVQCDLPVYWCNAMVRRDLPVTGAVCLPSDR